MKINWLYKAANEVQYYDECIGHHNGQTDCVIYAQKEEKVVGRLRYSLFRDELYVQYIEVAEDHRREGIATGMYLFMRDAFRDNKEDIPVNFGMSTPDGSEWVSSLPYAEYEI